MSYEGSSINPTVPAKSILYTEDGSTVTGVVGFQYTETGQIYNPASTNYIQLNDNTLTTNLKVFSNTGILIQSVSGTALEVDSLVVNLTGSGNGGTGIDGQYLGSDGGGHVIWETPTFSKPDAYGVIVFSETSETPWTIPITGLTDTGLVMVTYVTPGNGRAGQYITSLVPTAGILTVSAHLAFDLGDSIIWNVLKFE